MTREEVVERQQWSLNQKIDHSLGVIDEYYNKLDGKVYVAFSGGKDSTVLYWLARRIFPNIKAVFCNTRNEIPDIVKFVLDMKKNPKFNIDIVTPKIKPNEIIDQFGFPIISKQTAKLVYAYRNKPDSKLAEKALDNNTRHTARVAYKYRYLLNAPYECSDKCCDLLKKKPMHEYDLATKTYPILGTMACESDMRFTAYIKAGGCNTFNNRDKRKQKSRPLSIWMEEDIWACIEKYKIPICDIYYNKGITRTGCACCGFGAQFKDDMRFKYLYENHPKMYNYFMGLKNNGIEYRDVLRDMLKVNNLYLPDEKPLELF